MYISVYMHVRVRVLALSPAPHEMWHGPGRAYRQPPYKLNPFVCHGSQVPGCATPLHAIRGAPATLRTPRLCCYALTCTTTISLVDPRSVTCRAWAGRATRHACCRSASMPKAQRHGQGKSRMFSSRSMNLRRTRTTRMAARLASHLRIG